MQLNNINHFVPEQFIAFAYRGKLDELGVNTIQNYEEKDKTRPPFQKFFSPEFKGIPKFQQISFWVQSDDLKAVTVEVHNIYQQVISKQREEGNEDLLSSPFGVQIHITKNYPGCYTITQMAWSAFPKPGLAADILPVFKCKDPQNQDCFFMLTATRKAEPGKGKNATFGGFTTIAPHHRDLPIGPNNPNVLDSPIYTALREGKEEGNLRVEVPNIENYREDYEVSTLNGLVRCGESDVYSAKLIKLATIKTSDALMVHGGERLPNGDKRVYTTTGIACIVDLGDHCINTADKANDAFLQKFKFVAQDDMTGLQLNDITEVVKDPTNEFKREELKRRMEFGIHHHNDMVGYLIPVVNKYFYGENQEDMDDQQKKRHKLKRECEST